MTLAELNYSQIEKELRSVVFSPEKFRQYTYGRSVIVRNDHKPLVAIQKKPIAKAPRRLQKMLVRLTDYDYHLVHVPGKDMHLADALSRAYLPNKDAQMQFETMNCSSVADLTAEELQNAVDADQQMSLLRSTVQNGWPEDKANCPVAIRPFREFRDELTVHDRIVVKGQTIVVPLNLRRQFVGLSHTAHQGADSCIKRARDPSSGLEWLETSELQ